ncbi:DUF4157 domain-containing protein [Streptomyces sp. AM8-1-1]|uniref:eCIS core domain-containing protein n=1 Tax=Streptomyces sp. AM8-1-1 TaxID=3075825 RepID=UPI0028C4E7AA|nr:DUF4765 family protein [Streptomyces sp. AM8-1-1]WNO70247.1 DUF4765 family protein [Streptomyces sp. AM8-1-1]
MRAHRTPDRRAAEQDQDHRAAVPITAQRMLALQRSAGNAAVSRAVEEERHVHAAGCGHDQVVQRRSAVHEVLRTSGRPLDTPVREEMEARHGGADFGEVRVHSDAAAMDSATEIGAKAYTSGSHVVWDGRDKHTLAHELTHVIQQSRGVVPGTDNGSGLRVSDPSDWAERQAEDTARQVMTGPVPAVRAVQDETGRGAAAGAASVQRMELATNPTTLTESDSDYSSEDDLSAQEKQLPAPTSESAVEAAVAAGGETVVTLYRGDDMDRIRAMQQQSSAGGLASDSATPAPTVEQAAAQATKGRRYPEFTTATYTARQFSRQGPRGVVVVRIKAKYLTKGSDAPEDGWVALHSAPVEVIAVVDRSKGKTATGNAVNAS